MPSDPSSDAQPCSTTPFFRGEARQSEKDEGSGFPKSCMQLVFLCILNVYGLQSQRLQLQQDTRTLIAYSATLPAPNTNGAVKVNAFY